MPQEKSLALRLAEKKEADIKKLAELIAMKFIECATIRYKESHITIKFTRGGLFKETPIRMIIPKSLKKKIKYNEKISSEKTKSPLPELTKEGGIDIAKIVQSQQLELSDSDKIIMEIVEIFNNIDNTVPGLNNSGFSKEQDIVLHEVEVLLQKENFKIDITETAIRVSWWD